MIQIVITGLAVSSDVIGFRPRTCASLTLSPVTYMFSLGFSHRTCQYTIGQLRHERFGLCRTRFNPWSPIHDVSNPVTSEIKSEPLPGTSNVLKMQTLI